MTIHPHPTLPQPPDRPEVEQLMHEARALRAKELGALARRGGVGLRAAAQGLLRAVHLVAQSFAEGVRLAREHEGGRGRPAT